MTSRRLSTNTSANHTHVSPAYTYSLDQHFCTYSQPGVQFLQLIENIEKMYSTVVGYTANMEL